MPRPGGPESESRHDEFHIRLSRRAVLRYGATAIGGAAALVFIQRVFQAGEVQPPSLPTPTFVPSQPLSPAEQAVFPQQLIEKMERERGIPTPTPTDVLKNWKKNEYGPRTVVGIIRMSASAVIPEGWYESDIAKGEEWPGFMINEEWFSPNGDWSEYLRSGKAWMQIRLVKSTPSLPREDAAYVMPPPRKGMITAASIGGMFGSMQDFYFDDKNPPSWIQAFAAFLERTDLVLLIQAGSGLNRQTEIKPVFNKIYQNLRFLIMPDYVTARGKEVSSITTKLVPGTEGWKTYHYFTRHKDPWSSLKNPLMEVAVLLPPQWQFVGCDENAVSPCFLFGEDKSGKGLRQNIDKADTFGAGFVEETAGGVSLEKYLRKQIDFSIQSGRYRMTKEGKIQDMIVGKYRGRAQDFELELGDKPREGDAPGWMKVFSAPLADGTDRRFVILLGGRPIARRAELESAWNKVVQSMDLRFYHKLE